MYCLSGGPIELSCLTYGAIITSLLVPGRDGQRVSVVLGYDTLQSYLDNRDYLGAVVGRYANRIAYGRFELGGAFHQLATNDGPHHLHGGIRGFDRHLWSAVVTESADAVAVRLGMTSPDGDEHYPGTVRVAVTYTVRADATVLISYDAETDAATHVNLTQHSYFNLGGSTSPSVLDHELTIDGDRYTPIDATRIPTGELARVAGTPFDFRAPRRIGDQLARDHVQLRLGGGFDHNWVLRAGAALKPAARLRDPRSGRVLDIATTEPGLQFYGGQLLGLSGAGHTPFNAHSGLCLETQHFPDTPNRSNFPSTVLRPGEKQRSQTTWRFSTD